MSSPETQAWFKARSDYTNATLAQIPGLDKLVQTLVDYDKLLPVRYGEIKKRGRQATPLFGWQEQL